VPISAFLLFVVSAVIRGEECAFLAFFGLFLYFLQILLQLKTFSETSSVHIILILDATFVPNLTFSGLLSPEISLGEKLVTHPAPTLFI